MSPFCELCLYLAARSQLIEEKIVPLLKEGKIILCDRFNDATLAYQIYASGLPSDLMEGFNKHLLSKVKVDLTILFDVDVGVGLKRASEDHPKDRLEKKDIAYHKKVRLGYLELAKKDPQRIKVISSDEPIDVVQKKIQRLIEDALR